MKITFQPDEIICHQTLSSTSSPWGPQDGLRFYFMLEAGLTQKDGMISGRTYPPPDAVDNHPIGNGNTLRLSSFPPTGRGSWLTNVLDIDEDNLVTITLIGMNEGLPYIAGGGGSGPHDTLGAAFALGADIFFKEVHIPVISSLGEEMIELAHGLSHFPDCTGSAFIYRRQMTGADLIGALLRGQGRLEMRLTRQESLRTQTPRGDCNVPNYDVLLSARLLSDMKVDVVDKPVRRENTEPEPLDALIKHCARGEQIMVWAAQFDREILFKPRFQFRIKRFFWKVEGQEIVNDRGTITAQLIVEKLPAGTTSTGPITVEYVVDFHQNLRLRTTGTAGNYSILVEAFIELSSSEPPLRLFSSHRWIEGQQTEGDEGYQRYIDCVNGFLNRLRRIVLVKRRLHPLEPVVRPGLDQPRQLQRAIRLVQKLSEHG
jgi:hypothetical protein